MNKLLYTKISINLVQNILLYFFLFFILILPDYLLQIRIIEISQSILVVFIFLWYLIKNILQKKINIFLIISFIFFIWRSGSSYIINDSVHDIVNTLIILSLILIINVDIKQNSFEILTGLNILLSVYVLSNFLSLFVFPAGMYADFVERVGQTRPAWFLGINNRFSFYLVPASAIAALSSWTKQGKLSLNFWIITVIGALSLMMKDSMTGLVALLFTGILLIAGLVGKKIMEKFSFFHFLTGYSIVWVVLVIVNNTKVFQNFIVNVLQRDLTLSGRTNIWNATIEKISERPWLGYGINERVLLTAESFVAHNTVLQIILESGIIGFSIFMTIFLIVGTILYKNHNVLISYIITVGIFGILVGGLTEAYPLNFLFLLMALGYNMNKLVSVDIES